MSFDSIFYLCCFLPLVLALYWLTPGVKVKNWILLILGLIFYSFGSFSSILLLLGSTAVTYVLGLLIRREKLAKSAMILGVGGNLIFLLVYKYLGALLSQMFGLQQVAQSLIAPIGISFFTFKNISYLIDCYRSRETVTARFQDYLLYVSFFPQIMAGPITRFSDFSGQLKERKGDLDKITDGLQRFILGLFKKVILCSAIGGAVDRIFPMEASVLDFRLAWIGAIGYMVQIYFDFSGYSDMAIGMGNMLGFHTPENFNYPYIASSVADFWRRWHISLSTWFKDYLYIPLGGNRKGKIRTYINLIIVFACTGFWHGAAWNFLVWGLYHGFFQILERLGLKKVLEKIPRVFGHIYTILVFIIGWVLFRAESLKYAWEYVKTMFSFNKWGWLNAVAQLDGDTYPGTYTLAILVLGIILSLPIVPTLAKKIENSRGGETAITIIRGVGMIVLLGYSILCLTGSDYNPFIYFRF
jgi:alginate O-acetyltransferase complex protein AlgI